MNILRRNNVHVLEGVGTALLYAHGFDCSQNMWSRATPAFMGDYRQVLFDSVDSGQSDFSAFGPKRYSSLDAYEENVLEVCDALNLTSDVISIGHSVSSSIGVLTAFARPALFKKMVLLGPNQRFVNDGSEYLGGFERTDPDGLLALMDENYIGWANHLAPVVSSQEESGDVTPELSQSFCTTDPVAARAFAQVTFFSDNRADLQKVNPPCLVLQSRHDALAPVSAGEYVPSHLSQSSLEVFDVSGHCAHMSPPQLVVDSIRNFIKCT